MKMLLLLDIIIYGILVSSTWAWSVSMPSSISGLHKSCLVIPCKFSYSYYPPRNPYRIVWYQYVDRGYPPVYDSWNPYSVIERYRGRTSLYKGTYGDCSLLIKDLGFSHDGDRIYAWIDPENIGWGTYKFYDVTTLIHVSSSAPKPEVDISGGYKIGENIRVRCITYHTCPYNPPSLSLSGIQKTFDSLTDNYIGGGNWKITLTRDGVVDSEMHRVDCSVTHSGGLSASTTKIHNAECSINQAQITPDSNTEFLEGVEQDIICSVTYMCSSAQPQISWNDGIFNGINTYIRKQGIKYEARSTLKFKAKADDHRKTITCQTNFKGMVQRVQITLRVKRSMGSLDWSFTMPSAISGIRGSCVVIPCSYEFTTSNHSDVDVKWYSKTLTTTPGVIYDQSSDNIIPKFKGKTSLYGSSNETNCSLKIQPLDMSHNRERLFPWMDQNPPHTYHRENVAEETIALEVKDTVEKPQAEVLGRATVGEPVTLSCSVIHTCPPKPPTLSFSISHGSSRFIHTPLYNGKWKATKEITWTVEENDHFVTCSVSYAGGQESKTEIPLNPLCPIDQAQITPDSNTEFLEGVEQDIVCFVTYMCSRDRPYIMWSGEQLPGSTFHVTMHGTKQIAKSTLKFTPKASDNGKKITCQADFKGNVQTVEITLRI